MADEAAGAVPDAAGKDENKITQAEKEQNIAE